MTTLPSIIDLIHPTASGVGVFLSDTIWVLFDREIDETTLENGNFFVAGPDYDTWSGPDLDLYKDYESLGSEEEILQSPGYHGLVQGTYSFERISLTDADTTISGIDTVASGILYRTKVTFTPSERLAADTEYTVYLTGDEDSTDSLSTGISTRTVYDPITNPANTGDGSTTFTGSYTGSISDTFNVEITTAGAVGTARFKYWKNSTSSTIVTNLKTTQAGTLLSNGTTVAFESGVTYQVGDKFTCAVKPRDVFTSNLIWSFRTGSGSITTVPTTASTSVLGDAVSSSTTTSSSTAFSVSSTTPDDEASHQTIAAGPYTISVSFSDTIDATTVVSGVSVEVLTEPVDGDTAVPASGVCVAEPQVSGSTLNIVVASGYLLDNNMVTVTLDSGISSTSGTSLTSDYEFWFTTTYNPYYCTLRKIRLDVGSYITSVADDTVNFAIYMASKQADALTWNTLNLTEAYYQFVRTQYTCCRAQEIVLINASSQSGNLKSKQLGDLKVEYQPGNNDALDRALACMEKWENSLHAGGFSVQNPSMVIKGAQDPDRPAIGRGWEFTNGIRVPAANTSYRKSTSRRYKNTYSRGYRGKGRYDK